jgi:Ser/Thr protein kinase RdoA (MazF antagonist)
LGAQFEIIKFGSNIKVISDFSTILEAYALPGDSKLSPIGSGLIHKTWKLAANDHVFVLQQVNQQVFHEPPKISENLRLLEEYIQQTSPAYPFVSPLPASSGERIIFRDGAYYRLFPYVMKSNTFDAVSTPELAYEAAYQFSMFSRVFAGFDSARLNVTIPHFHDLGFREAQFDDAIVRSNGDRIRQSQGLIRLAHQYTWITDEFRRIEKGNLIKKRVTHHDTKISNVLFDPTGKGITVIDLDTVMAGYYISDLGDMMRTYLSPASEEESDFSCIGVREDFFEAIVHGFLENMGAVLTKDEQEFIFYSGSFLIYMQAIRFLTDFLNNDIYYGARYEDHNFVRAGNQLMLLKHYLEKKDLLQTIIAKC